MFGEAPTTEPATYVLNIEHARELAHAETVKRALESRLAILEAENERLRHQQITGDDYRLAEFWEKAQELADAAGHCQVFDELAEELGGPRRRRSGHVHVQTLVTYTVEVDDIEDYSDEDFSFENASVENVEYGTPEVTDHCQD